MGASSIAWCPRLSTRLESILEAEGDLHQVENGYRVELRHWKPSGLDGASTHFVNRLALGGDKVNSLDHLEGRSRSSSLLRCERIGVDPE